VCNPLELAVILKKVSVDRIIELRHRMLREGLPAETAHFSGDDDPNTLHFAAFLADHAGEEMGKTVCCASFMLNPLNGEPAWQLRGMATALEFQGQGVGRNLLRFSEKTLAEQSRIRFLWCNARLPAVTFYEKQGWCCISGVFQIPTAGPHRKMTKTIS
jgi:GNAT superfamily N-acetyltransferase